MANIIYIYVLYIYMMMMMLFAMIFFQTCDKKSFLVLKDGHTPAKERTIYTIILLNERCIAMNIFIKI